MPITELRRVRYGVVAVVLLAAAVLSPLPAAAQQLSAAAALRWQQDLDYMVGALEKYHADAFHDVSRAVLERRVAQLRARIPRLSRNDAILGLAGIVALVGDAHTGFSLGTTPPVSFHSFPIKVYEYSDGVFVQAASPEHRRLVGKQITAIGGIPIAEALRRLKTVFMSTNDWSFRSQLQFAFKGEVFHGLGLANSDDRVTLEFQDGGRRETEDLTVMSQPFAMGYKPGPPQGSAWIGAASSPPPLYLRNLDKFYWYEWLPETQTLYVQCNFILNDPHESFEDFFKEVFAAADARPVGKFILDLRFNGGGDNSLSPLIVQNLVKRQKLNARGKLFVIIGRLTQSAAENLVNRLQRDTQATFVGEPTGERPNMYGDPWPFVLPNSRIVVNIASIRWEDIDPRDDREWTGPDIAAELSSSDYAAGIDPAMNAVSGAAFVPIADVLRPFVAGDAQAFAVAYRAYIDEPAHKFTQTQPGVDQIADMLLASSRFELAQSLLLWNLERAPRSPQAMDALCDAYLAQRDIAKATSCFTAVLASFPHDSVAASRLSTLAAGVLPNT